MKELEGLITTLMAWGTLGMIGFSVAVIGGMVMEKRRSLPTGVKVYWQMLKKYSLLLAFLIVLGSLLGSLYFSDVVGLAPCLLCWYQRVFMYPLVPMFGYALLKKDDSIREYGLLLSVLGGLIGGYQFLLQKGLVVDIANCSVTSLVDCAQPDVNYFGFMTIPFMSLVMFVTVAVLMVVGVKKSKTN